MSRASKFTPWLVGGAAALLLVPALVTGQQTNRLDRIAAALEAYALDNGGAYPHTFPSPNTWFLPKVLSTPVAYLGATDMLDPFASPGQNPNGYLRYINIETTFGPAHASYPHLKARHGSWMVWSGSTPSWNPDSNVNYDMGRYDPTNGTQNRSSIRVYMTHSYRSQRMKTETGVE